MSRVSAVNRESLSASMPEARASLVIWAAVAGLLVAAVLWGGGWAPGLATGLSLAIAGAVIIRSVRIESRLASQRTDEARYQAELRRLSAAVATVQEAERRSIARELHDEVGQALTALKMELSGVKVDTVEGRSADALARARAIADDVVQSIRDLSRLLHTPMLESMGLVPALERYLHDFGRRYRVAASLSVDGEWPELDVEVEQTIYRIVQEALTNVAKHAKAKTCRVLLRGEQGAAVVTVSDDGIGFEGGSAGDDGAAGRGLGLIGIRERAALWNGTMEVSRGGQAGATVSVVFPAGGGWGQDGQGARTAR